MPIERPIHEKYSTKHLVGYEFTTAKSGYRIGAGGTYEKLNPKTGAYEHVGTATHAIFTGMSPSDIEKGAFLEDGQLGVSSRTVFETARVAGGKPLHEVAKGEKGHLVVMLGGEDPHLSITSPITGISRPSAVLDATASIPALRPEAAPTHRAQVLPIPVEEAPSYRAPGFLSRAASFFNRPNFSAGKLAGRELETGTRTFRVQRDGRIVEFDPQDNVFRNTGIMAKNIAFVPQGWKDIPAGEPHEVFNRLKAEGRLMPVDPAQKGARLNLLVLGDKDRSGRHGLHLLG